MAKIGAGHAKAMLRLGLKELRNAANPSKESVADSEIGLYGTQTQGEIAKARGGPGGGHEQEASEKKYSLDELRGIAKEAAEIAAERMTEQSKGQDNDKGNEPDREQDVER